MVSMIGIVVFSLVVVFAILCIIGLNQPILTEEEKFKKINSFGCNYLGGLSGLIAPKRIAVY